MAHNDAGGAGYTLAELAGRSGATLDGDGAIRVTRRDVERAGPGAIAFLQPRYASQLRRRTRPPSSSRPGTLAARRPQAGHPDAHGHARIAAVLHPPVTEVRRILRRSSTGRHDRDGRLGGPARDGGFGHGDGEARRSARRRSARRAHRRTRSTPASSSTAARSASMRSMQA
jgi:hypothetical protein